jgi:hypothetical protein
MSGVMVVQSVEEEVACAAGATRVARIQSVNLGER